MPRNTLVIGLGGTGVWSATYLKRDLIQTYGQVPPNVKIICFDTISLDPRKVEQMKREGRVGEDYGLPSIGGIALEEGKEYIYVGGDAQPICQELRGDTTGMKHPTIRPWLQYDWYLRNLPPAQMDLDAGASWRQFGRLSVFLNESNVYQNLQGAVQSFPANQHLDIVLVSSLGGGTGSGMFVDIALLARHFAEGHFQQIDGQPGYTVFGVLATGSTFSATGADLNSIYRNCFAAWRTLDRFLRTPHCNYKIAHPNHEHIYTQALFDYCALVGALRPQDSLHGVRPEFGVFPSISDFLFAMIDDAAGGNLSQLVFRNLARTEAALNQERPEWDRRRFCFSFGTYAYIYPADDIVTELTLQFAKELLDSYFLKEIEVSGVGEGRTYTLKSVQEPLTYRDDFCRNPGDPDLQRFLNLLPRVALENPEMAKAFTMDSMISMLRNYDPQTPPNQQQKDEEIINRRVWAKPSKKHGDDLVAGATRIPNEVQGYKAVHLGHLVDPETNLRLQGEFQQVLERFSGRLKTRFAKRLGGEVVRLLNGTANAGFDADQRVLQGENLCLAIFFVERLIIDVFEPFIQACQEAQKVVLQEYARQTTIVNEVRNDMVEARYSTWLTPIPIISYLRAHNLQYAYIAQEQELIDIECKYHCFDALINTTKGFIEIADRVLEELRRWKKILVDELYDDILTRLEQHRVMRDNLNRIKVRKYLTDRQHEIQLYQQYRKASTPASHNKPAMDDALDSLRWREVGSWLDETGRLELVRYEGDSNAEVDTFKDDKHYNRRVLEGLIRPYFEPIRHESILDRLAGEFARGIDFVGDADQHAFPMTMAGGQDPGVIIAIPRAQTPQHQQFRGTGQPNIANPVTVQDEVARRDQGQGNYTLNVLANRQVALIVRMTMGITGEDALDRESVGGQNTSSLYDRSTPKSILHLFPAEINATDYEAKLQEVDESYRYLHPEVIVLLEDRNRFESFVMAYLVGLVKEEQITDQGQRVWTYLLDLQGQRYRLTLNTHPTDPLRLLTEAASYFVVGRDAINGNRTFDPASVLNECYQSIDRDTQRRPYRQLRWLDKESEKLKALIENPDQRLKDLGAVMKLKVKEVRDNISRTLGANLVDLLEHPEKLRIFCFAWLYDLVKSIRERKDQMGNPLFDWVLEIGNDRWWLNEQGVRSNPWQVFLQAARQFVITGSCAESKKQIDFREVNNQWQAQVQGMDAQEFAKDVHQRLKDKKEKSGAAGDKSMETLLQIFEDIVKEEIIIREAASP